MKKLFLIIICISLFILPIVFADFRNYFGIGWYGKACDNILFAKNMGYDYVIYQTGMENCPNANNLSFYLESPEYSAYPSYMYQIDYAKPNEYTLTQQEELKKLFVWKSNDSYPYNFATEWFFTYTSFRPVLDFQRQEIIDYAVIKALDKVKKKENKTKNFLFGGYAWDVPSLTSDFFTARQKSPSYPNGTGKIVNLSYWNKDGIETGYDWNNSYNYDRYSNGRAAFMIKLYNETRKIYPNMKLFYEPYTLYGSWLKTIEGRDDKYLLMPENQVILTQESCDNLAQCLYFVTDTNIYKTGLINKGYVGFDSPDNHEHLTNLIVTGTAAINGAWTSWFGRWGGSDGTPLYPNVTEVPMRLKLIRMIPNWDNLNNISLNNRSWNNVTHIYNSTNSYANINIIYTRHPITHKLFAVILNKTSSIYINSNERVTDLEETNGFFTEINNASDNFNITNNKLTLLSSLNEQKGYIITLENIEQNITINDTPIINNTPIINDTPIINNTPKNNDVPNNNKQLNDNENQSLDDPPSKNTSCQNTKNTIIGAFVIIGLFAIIGAIVAIIFLVQGSLDAGELLAILGGIIFLGVILMIGFFVIYTISSIACIG